MTVRPAFAGRNRALFAVFHKHVEGKSFITSKHEAELFMEAFDMLSTEKSPTYCVESIASNENGTEALRMLVRRDTSAESVNFIMERLMKHLADPRVKAINNGDFLNKILVALLAPPTFWLSLVCHLRAGKLSMASVQRFAWLCLEIVTAHCDELQLLYHNVSIIMNEKLLLESTEHPTRELAYRIEKVLKIRTISQAIDVDYSPGGRHDNDFADFRAIAILPTSDEVKAKDEPYLQRLADVFETPLESRPATYIDWLFRSLREDMLVDLREELAIAWGQKKGRRKCISLGKLRISRQVHKEDHRLDPLSLSMSCEEGVSFPKRANSESSRKKYLANAGSFLKHGALGLLCSGHDIIAFGCVVREVDALVKNPPVVTIRFTTGIGLKRATEALLRDTEGKLRFYVVNTATFAYEPILKRLQQIDEIPLEAILLQPDTGQCSYMVPERLSMLLSKLRDALGEGKRIDLAPILKSRRSLSVSGAQLESLINGLESPIGQIQGPPGTGKSFIGALIAKIILDFTSHRILILSYTNHALDQTLENLLDIGVDQCCMVRLGSKSTSRTAAIKLEAIAKESEFRFSGAIHSKIRGLKSQASDLGAELSLLGCKLGAKYPAWQDILGTLEFSETYSGHWISFQAIEDGKFEVVGKKNKRMTPSDMLRIWADGGSLTAFRDVTPSQTTSSTWMLAPLERTKLLDCWSTLTRQKQVEEYVEMAASLQAIQEEINSLYNESKRKALRSKRVIGCTTTAAAKYQSIIETAQPDIVLVEEAGEILEAHVITALSPSVQRLVLIGDHKQLRPKINSYKLSIEKGDGFNMNVSLFERLINQGHHFTALQEQHRCHPDISYFTRHLSYPDLKDMPKTLGHLEIRGVQARVVFAHHEQPENDLTDVADMRDGGSPSSKRNTFEAQMVVKMVRYLIQQGYKSENIVVLTPYLGQLSLLRDTISQHHDAYLNDHDSYDLLRAGLMTEAATKVKKSPLRLSTIDNYQGEESDLVVASLTRSNAKCDIGFMSARERLVVLMSRARNGIFLFGNMNTFMGSKKGGAMWTDFLGKMKEKGFLFDGVPIHCERHLETAVVLKSPRDFDEYCPEGGCAAPCGQLLSCGQHKCPLRCHFTSDHSRTPCQNLVQQECERRHKANVQCSEKNRPCKKCKIEDEETKRRVKRDLQLERTRQEQQEKYASERNRIRDEIEHYRRKLAYEEEAKSQEKDLNSKERELRSLKEAARRRQDLAEANIAAEGANTKPSENYRIANSSPLRSGEAAKEWEKMKAIEKTDNDALNELMGMIGLESIKEQFLGVKSSIDTKVRQGLCLSAERLSCSLLGNPGTGKTTVARLWARFLTWVGAVPGSGFEEATGSKLANGGVSACEKLLEKLKDDGGGVLFIDEAYQLSSGNSPGGKAVLDFLLAEVENLRGKVVFVIAGYSKQMESFFAHNPGFASRFPITMNFQDYTDNELLEILQWQINRNYKGRMKIEGGLDGLYCRIASRRVGRGRGKDGFGNARAIENAFSRITHRQAARLRVERGAGNKPDYFLLSKEDMIGPEPSAALQHCEAWKRLHTLIGLDEVKDEVKAFMTSLATNYERELAEEPLMTFSLNRIFVGSPGTGKTTVAKLYGEILAALGLLSNGEVVVKRPADFVGSALGQSEAQTKAILSSTIGKVLLIDEAYGLYGGASVSDPYRTAVVDTIVAEVQNVPGEDRCVVLLGYREEMDTMFQNVNPGLSRRFSIDSPFVFHDFDDECLERILNLKLKESALKAAEKAKNVAMEVLKRERTRPNFGNAGAIDNLLSQAKTRYQKRASLGRVEHGVLVATDFDENFDRLHASGANIRQLFAEQVGREATILKFEKIQSRARQLKSLDMDIRQDVPFNFLFRGPPGTGKTSTARKMGVIYYDLGVLSTTEVVECSATNLIGEYVGQTGPKVQKLLDSALGKVLFIDEAYRLSGGAYAKEAVDELVDCVTKEKYMGKLIIILAGYVHHIDQLLSVNPGMSSRFPECIDFESFDPESCFTLLGKLLGDRKKELNAKGKPFDISCLLSPNMKFKQEVLGIFRSLTIVEGWANARDVEQISKDIFREVDLSQTVIQVEKNLVTAQLQKMLQERQTRERSKLRDPIPSLKGLQPVQKPLTDVPQPLQTRTEIQVQSQEHVSEPEEEVDCSVEDDGKSLLGIRDASVTDEVWEQLCRDALEEQRQETELQALKKKQKCASDADRALIVKQILEEEERREREQANREKLMKMGACPMGYRWIKQQGGYRCAGGSHWMSNDHVDEM